MADNVLNDTQAGVVADAEPNQNVDVLASGADAAAAAPSGAGEQAAGASPKPRQSRQTNDAMAELRRRAEAAEAQAEKYRRVGAAIKGDFGADSDDPDELYIAVQSQKTGKQKRELAAELREQEAAREAELKRRLENDPETLENKRLAAEYRKLVQEREFERDLAAIRAKYPDETAKNVSELGGEFVKLRAADVDLMTAYEVIRAKRPAATPPAEPAKPEPGAAEGTVQPDEKDFYTPQEVDKLTKEQLRNPTILQRVVSSMSKWQKQ